MGFTFIYTNDYNIGIEQLMPILGERGIDTDLVFSRYNFIEMAHLQYMAACGEPRDGERARQLLAADEDRIVERVRRGAPSVVGFSATTDTYRWCLGIASRIKRDVPACAVVMGGAHPTFASERVIAQPAVDAICIGEADLSVTALYEALSRRSGGDRVAGAWIKEGDATIRNAPAPLVRDLDSLPFKDGGLFVKHNPGFARTYNALTARGCPFNCSYCNSSSYKRMYPDGYLRKRSPSSVLEELARAKSLYGFERVVFVDDVFTMDYRWLADFLPLYRQRIGIPFYCLIHPDMVTGDTIRMLKEAGCDMIKCGIQSINPVRCRTVFRRNLDIEKIATVICDIKRAGIGLKLDFIIGAPEETEQDLQELVGFIKEVDVDDIFLYFLKYYPGSDLIERALERGYITRDDYEDAQEGREAAYQIIPGRFRGEMRDLYLKYNALIRDAAGSKFGVSQFRYLLEGDGVRI